MKIIGYTRVSTDSQAEKGHSLAAQREKIESYCRLYEYELVAVIDDPGASAKTLDRPGLECALKTMRDNNADGLIVAKLDRLTRSVRDLNVMIETVFDRERYELISVAENLDTKNAAGRLVLNILGSVSQWEREAIGERTSAAMQQMRTEGRYTGGRIPYGYDLENGYLVPNSHEQKCLKIVRQMELTQKNLSAIGRSLAEMGFTSRNGKPYTTIQVQRLLKTDEDKRISNVD